MTEVTMQQNDAVKKGKIGMIEMPKNAEIKNMETTENQGPNETLIAGKNIF